MSEYIELLSEEEDKMQKLKEIETIKPFARRMISSGYFKIIDYLMKVGDRGSYILEIAKALNMNPGDVRHKLIGLRELFIVKVVDKAPASHPIGGGRPKTIYCINYELWSWKELAEILNRKKDYELYIAKKVKSIREKLKGEHP